jgi:CNT family concentrative nucleoside transporter
LALLILTVPWGKTLFQTLGHGIEALLKFSDAGAAFVFGDLVRDGRFIFAFKLVPTIVFISALVSVAYHLGLLQRVVSSVGWAVSKLLGVSGAEALSNAASAFVGQVEAQLLIKPYLASMTRSELLTVMAGSMACIAGGVMAVYISMGIPAHYLLAASVMAIPGALVVAKIMVPETEISPTKDGASLEIPIHTVNLIDALAHGALEGIKIGIAVCGVLIAFIALIAMADGVLGWVSLKVWGQILTFKQVVGWAFLPVAWLLGVPMQEAQTVGALMGTKLVANEFVAYADLAPRIVQNTAASLSPRAIAVASFALCGFANLGSIAIQVGGIGEMVPERKQELAKLGLKALFCGSVASYLSAAWAGLLITPPAPWIIPSLAALAVLVLGGSLFWEERVRKNVQDLSVEVPPQNLASDLLPFNEDVSPLSSSSAPVLMS